MKTTRRQHRPRLNRDQVRDLVVEAGVALLFEDGLAASRAPIGYADAFRWLSEHRSMNVSRAQIHRRIWDSVDDYRRDVLTELTAFPPEATYGPTLAAVARELDGPALVTSATAPASDRRNILIRLARAAVEANAAAARADRQTTAFDALWAMHSFGAHADAEDDPVRSGVFAGQQQSVDRFLSLYDQLSEVFDARAGTHWGLSHEAGVRLYAELLYCVNHGAASRSVHQFQDSGLAVGGEQWTVEGLTAAAVTGCMATMAEPHTRRRVEGCVVVPRLVTDGNNERIDLETEPSEFSQSDRRMERSALRRHMLEAGVALILDGGFGHGAEHVTYSRVFDRIKGRAGVSIVRAQVHGRIWPSQREFQHEVLATAVDGAAAHPGSATLDRTIADTRVAAGLPAAAHVIRECGAMTAMTCSPSWLLSQAVASFHALNPQRSLELDAALEAAYQRDIRAWGRSFGSLCEATGLTARTWTGCSTEEACLVLAHCADALAEGVAGRIRMSGHPPTYRLRVAGTSPAPWDLFGIGLWSLIDFLLEPRPSGPQVVVGAQNST